MTKNEKQEFLIIVGKRIKSLREASGMSQDELAKRVGYKSRTSINKIELGINDIPQCKIKALSTALNTTPTILMGWEEQQPIASNLVPLEQVRRIPLLSKIACGSPILASDNILCYIPCPLNVNADFALTCQGDSMENANIYDGDIVYIKKQPTVENGEIAVVLYKGENEGTLKRFYQNGDTVVLQPENSKYQPTFIQQDDINNLLIQGKAVAVLHEL